MGRNDPIPSDLEGRIIGGNYLLCNLIRQTNKSYVFEATEVGEVSSKRDIAVKILKPGQGTARENQFITEVETHGKLGEHPNIANFYNSGREKEYLYAAMERVPGKDLEEQIKEGMSFSLRDILNIMTTISNVSEFIHKEVGGHHDIKTKNIKFEAKSRGYLLDFGGRLKESAEGYNDVHSLGVVLEDLVKNCDKNFKGKIKVELEGIVKEAKGREYKTPKDLEKKFIDLRKSIDRRSFMKKATKTMAGGAILGGAIWGGFEIKRSHDRQKEYEASLEFAVQQVRDSNPDNLFERIAELGRRICYQKVLPWAKQKERGKSPYAIPPGKRDWNWVAEFNWSSGFGPRILWNAFELTQDEEFKDLAMKWIRPMKLVENDSKSIGPLRFYHSHVRGFEILEEESRESLKEIALEAAQILLKRFNPYGEYIQLSGPIRKSGPHFSYIDTMNALPLLSWAFAQEGEEAYKEAIESHCNTLRKFHFNSDGSTLQVTKFDTRDSDKCTGIKSYGYSGVSCFSRGQMNAIDGFTRGYKITGDEILLETAEQTARYFCKHLPENYVPFYDFKDPHIPHVPRDTSAAPISELKALYKLTKNPEYESYSDLILQSLITGYLSTNPNYQGIILKGCANKNKEEYVGTSLIYGDSKFTDALTQIS